MMPRVSTSTVSLCWDIFSNFYFCMLFEMRYTYFVQLFWSNFVESDVVIAVDRGSHPSSDQHVVIE